MAAVSRDAGGARFKKWHLTASHPDGSQRGRPGSSCADRVVLQRLARRFEGARLDVVNNQRRHRHRPKARVLPPRLFSRAAP